jgi:hypothetical protein
MDFGWKVLLPAATLNWSDGGRRRFLAYERMTHA